MLRVTIPVCCPACLLYIFISTAPLSRQVPSLQREVEGVRYCSLDSQLGPAALPLPFILPPSLRNTASSDYTPIELWTPKPPQPLLLLLPCQLFRLTWSPVYVHHKGLYYPLCGWHAQQGCGMQQWAPRRRERVKSDGNVILEAFYRNLNSPGAYLHMHTHAQPHTQQIQCCDSRVKPRYPTIIYASIILRMLLYSIIWLLLQSITGLIMAIIDIIIGYLLIRSAHSSNHRWEETTVSFNDLYVQHSHSWPL